MKIEELIDRYFEGQTSCEEERELRSFFTQENVPESLQVYRPLFVCLDQEAKAFRQESAPVKKPSFRPSLYLHNGRNSSRNFISDRHCRYAAIPSPHSGKLRHYRRQAIHGCKPGA